MSDWHASPFTGLFTRFGAMTSRPHDPDCALSSGEFTTWTSGQPAATASGIGWDADAAAGACVGEAIERLQCAPLPDDEIITASYADWSRPELAIDPVSWILFHKEQYRQPGFPFQPLTRDTLCDWIAFREAVSGERRWIPIDLAFLHLPAGHRVCPGYSTGLAAGRIGEPVLLRGLQEVIERDAVMGAWWRRYSIEEYTPPLDEATRARIERPNLTYRFFRIASPFSFHVTMVTLEGEDREGYCFSIGSSCRETRRQSWMKSLQEAIHGRHYVRYLKKREAIRSERPPASFAEHAAYYSLHPWRLKETILAPTAGRSRVEPFADEVEGIDRLMERLGTHRPVLFRSMAPPALAAEDLGWQVLRVVVPGLQPMHGDHALPHLGGPLWSPRGLAEWRNVPPHPFP
ncbi:MAG TPA: YcaO-like family protein [Gemmataceae bacterium]|nr:YcaO-like family protein [Gemmataceae bacterium]